MKTRSDTIKVKTIANFLRKLRGGSQASLVVADDAALYAVKFDSNPQGQLLLFNEALASELYRLLKLPTPSWAPFLVDDAYLDANPGVWFELPSGKRRPPA